MTSIEFEFLFREAKTALRSKRKVQQKCCKKDKLTCSDGPYFESLESYRLQGSIGSIYYIPEFVQTKEAGILVEEIYDSIPQNKWAVLTGRRVMNIGGIPHPDGMIERPNEFPDFMHTLSGRLIHLGIFSTDKRPNHCLLNEYTSQEGIALHKDGPLFESTVAIISLDGPAAIEFHKDQSSGNISVKDGSQHASSKQNRETDIHTADHAPSAAGTNNEDDKDKHSAPPSATASSLVCSIYLEPRSLLIFKDEAYTRYRHCIPTRPVDIIDSTCLNRHLLRPGPGPGLGLGRGGRKNPAVDDAEVTDKSNQIAQLGSPSAPQRPSTNQCGPNGKACGVVTGPSPSLSPLSSPLMAAVAKPRGKRRLSLTLRHVSRISGRFAPASSPAAAGSTAASSTVVGCNLKPAGAIAEAGAGAGPAASASTSGDEPEGPAAPAGTTSRRVAQAEVEEVMRGIDALTAEAREEIRRREAYFIRSINDAGGVARGPPNK